VLHKSTAWFTCHPWDNRANLCSSKLTASSFRHSISTTTILPLRSRREKLGHHSRPHQWGTRATTTGRLCTSPRNATSQGRPTQYRWQISRGASKEAQRNGLAMPSTPPWKRYPWERKFLWVCSSSTNTPSLYCLILELHMIS
jgi:hypothetical protein